MAVHEHDQMSRKIERRQLTSKSHFSHPVLFSPCNSNFIIYRFHLLKMIDFQNISKNTMTPKSYLFSLCIFKKILNEIDIKMRQVVSKDYISLSIPVVLCYE